VWGPLIQVDDVGAALLPRLLPFAFAAVETSPGNYQAWLALGSGTTEDGRRAVRDRLLQKFKAEGETANGGAYNAVRLPGSLNVKEKYMAALGHYPRVRLVHVAPGRTASPPELERAGLLAPVAPPAPRPVVPRDVSARLPSGWPDLARYKSLKWKADENRPDRSSAEAAWVGAAWRMGWPESMIVAQLERITEKGRAGATTTAQRPSATSSATCSRNPTRARRLGARGWRYESRSSFLSPAGVGRQARARR